MVPPPHWLSMVGELDTDTHAFMYIPALVLLILP